MKQLILGITLSIAICAQAPNRAEVQLQAAINKETVEGDLKSAIAMYRKVAMDHKANRLVASRALLRLAEAQEKMGETEARKAYEQILRDYADQQPAGIARARLAALGRTTPAMTARRLPGLQPGWWTGTPNPVSPDGRSVFVSMNENGVWNPAILDLATGQPRRLPKPPGSGYIDSGVLSADNRLIAFTPQPTSGHLDLTIANIDGSNPRAILRTSPSVSWLYPLGFTAGNQSVVVAFNREGKSGYNLGRVDVATGRFTVIKEFPNEFLTQPRLSPDGQWIVYAARKSSGNPALDLFTIRPDGSQEHVLVEHAANDTFPVWTTDGKGVMFLTNRRGSLDLWHVSVHEGKPAGDERNIKPDIGNVDLVGCTRDGSLIYRVSAGSVSFFHSTFDTSTGKFRPFQELKESYAGQKLRPRISPDEKQLAYVRRPDYAKDKAIIGVRNLVTGKEREVMVPSLRLIGWVLWMPDQRNFYVGGTAPSGANGHFLVDAQSGEAKALPVPTGESEGYVGLSVLSLDGTTLYTLVSKPDGSGGRLFARDVATGSTRKLLETGGRLYQPWLSPDGLWLAFMESQGQSTVAGRILSIADGSVRDLPAGVTVSGWSRDSKSVYVFSLKDSIREVSGKKMSTLFRMPLEGGPLTPVTDPMDYSMADSEQFLGNTAVFRTNRQLRELWALDNIFGPTK